MALVAYSTKTGKLVKIGDEVEDFRGEKGIVDDIYLPNTSAGGRTGKVIIKNRVGIYYASVYSLAFVEETEYPNVPTKTE